jgi:hypothetical protein
MCWKAGKNPDELKKNVRAPGTITMNTIPETLPRSDWIPFLSKDDVNNSWKAFFRTFMPCPNCGHDASTTWERFLALPYLWMDDKLSLFENVIDNKEA